MIKIMLKPFFKKLGEKFTITKVTSGIIGAALSFVKTFAESLLSLLIMPPPYY